MKPTPGTTLADVLAVLRREGYAASAWCRDTRSRAGVDVDFVIAGELFKEHRHELRCVGDFEGTVTGDTIELRAAAFGKLTAVDGDITVDPFDGLTS